MVFPQTEELGSENCGREEPEKQETTHCRVFRILKNEERTRHVSAFNYGTTSMEKGQCHKVFFLKYSTFQLLDPLFTPGFRL